MSAEQLVQDIIEQALSTAREKSDAAEEFSARAITASMGSAFPVGHVTGFTPGAVEPNVVIPRNVAGVDGALFGATYDQIVEDMSSQFAAFFTEYFPNECDYLTQAQTRLCEILEGKTGIPAHIEDQIWNRDRARVLTEVGRVQQELIAGFAARGFPLPTGAAVHAMQMAQVEAQNKVAQQSRDVAIKHVDILIDNIKFAIGAALDYRIKAIQAAGDYIKTLALGPDIAMKLATSAAGAQAQLITAAAAYYRNRIAVEELRLDAAKFDAGAKTEVSIAHVREFSNRLKAQADTLAAAARAAGDQAAAALNAVHASAGIAVQGETA